MERKKIERLYDLLNEFYMNIEHEEEINTYIDLVLDEIYCDYLMPSLNWCLNK